MGARGQKLDVFLSVSTFCCSSSHRGLSSGGLALSTEGVRILGSLKGLLFPLFFLGNLPWQLVDILSHRPAQKILSIPLSHLPTWMPSAALLAPGIGRPGPCSLLRTRQPRKATKPEKEALLPLVSSRLLGASRGGLSGLVRALSREPRHA